MDQTARNSAASEGGLPTQGFADLVPELDVRDLNASLAFWCDLLGFRVAYSRAEAKFAYLERGAMQVMLCEINGEWITGVLDPPFGRGMNLQMTVRDLDAIAEHLRNAGVPLFRPIEEKTYRVGPACHGTREFLVQDPDGYLLRFVEPLGATEHPCP